MALVKERLFEYFVCRSLLLCNSKLVTIEIIGFYGRRGITIQGVGQARNADVLLELSFQTP